MRTRDSDKDHGLLWSGVGTVFVRSGDDSTRESNYRWKKDPLSSRDGVLYRTRVHRGTT